MMKQRLSLATILAIGVVVTLFSACVWAARGDDTSTGKPKGLLVDLEKAKGRLGPAYKLAYQFTPGESYRTKVVHLATVETKVKGVAQTTRSRTISTRAWKIRDVDPSGNITFDHSVERVEMWNSVDGRQDVSYDSASGE